VGENDSKKKGERMDVLEMSEASTGLIKENLRGPSCLTGYRKLVQISRVSTISKNGQGAKGGKNRADCPPTWRGKKKNRSTDVAGKL